MAKKKISPPADSSLMYGMSAPELANLCIRLINVGIVRMEPDADPCWLCHYFLGACEKDWLKFQTLNSPSWSLTVSEMAEVAISLATRVPLSRYDNHQRHIKAIELRKEALEWIANARNTIEKFHTMHRHRSQFQGLEELNEYDAGEKMGDERVPLHVVLRLAGCDEMELTVDELASQQHTKDSFAALPSEEKHLIRYAVLRSYPATIQPWMHCGKTGNPRLGDFYDILLPGIVTGQDGRRGRGGVTKDGFPITVELAISMAALRDIKQKRLVEVRRHAAKARTKRKSK